MNYWTPLWRQRRVLTKSSWLVAFFCLLFLLLAKAGVFERFQETPYSEYSHTPELDAEDLLRTLRAGREPTHRVLNHYERYDFRIPNELKCHVPRGRTSLLIVIRSAVAHRSRRDVIRQTWGQEDRFEDVDLKRVFMVGVQADDETSQGSLNAEHALHGDMVQADFVDSYYNTTIKTMLSFRWVVEQCSGVQWAFFVDDDYYVSTKSLVEFLRVFLDPKDRHLVGFVYEEASPIRTHWSKWYVSLSEYPFSQYPPFAIGGSYVLSMPALVELYQVARYTRHFRFDDVFLGMLAKKIGLRPRHSDKFREKNYPRKPEDFVGLVAAHGFGDPEHLVWVWERQMRLGHA